MTDEQSNTNSKLFALRAAQWVGCNGAHKHEGKWMPCETHEELLKLSGEAEPKRKTAYIDLHKRYGTRKAKGRKKKRGWENLRETKPLGGFATLEGGGIVSAPINSTIYSGGIKSYIPNTSPRDNDPDVFTDIESARKRSRMLGCIGVRRMPSATGRTVWLPCTNNTDYARLAGTTFLGRRGQAEANRRVIRTVVRRELQDQARRSKIKKKSLYEELNNKSFLGRAIGSAGNVARGARRAMGKIEGVLDRNKRRDANNNGLIFDGTWMEMPDPTPNVPKLASGGRPNMMPPGGPNWWATDADNRWLTPKKIKKGGALKASELLNYDRLRMRRNRDEQARVLGVPRATIDAMYEPDASLTPYDADRLTMSALDLHPALIWGSAWLESSGPESNRDRLPAPQRTETAKTKKTSLDERDKQILDLRERRKTFQEIADQLGISKQRAEQLYRQALTFDRETLTDDDDSNKLKSGRTARIGQIERDERGVPILEEDKRGETIKKSIQKMRDLGLTEEEINLLFTGDRNTPPETETPTISQEDLRKVKRQASGRALRSGRGPMTLKEMADSKPDDWPQNQKVHIANWGNSKPSFNVPYSIARRFFTEGSLSDRDWKTLLRFYTKYGPEQRLRSGRSVDSRDYTDVGAERMIEIIIDRVPQVDRKKPSGTRTHFNIIGPGGMGKSTLVPFLRDAGLLPSETEAAHVDPDFIKFGVEGYNGGKGSPGEQLAVHKASARAATRAVNKAADEGMDIITEGTGMRLHEYKTIDDPSYRKVVHVPYTPYSIAEQRVKKRNETGERQLPISEIRGKGYGLYDTTTELAKNGATVYIWDMDVPKGAAPKVIAKVEDGVFTAFDEPKFKAWSEQHGGSKGGDKNLEHYKSRFPAAK